MNDTAEWEHYAQTLKVSEDTQRSGNVWLVRLYQNRFGSTGVVIRMKTQ